MLPLPPPSDRQQAQEVLYSLLLLLLLHFGKVRKEINELMNGIDWTGKDWNGLERNERIRERTDDGIFVHCIIHYSAAILFCPLCPFSLQFFNLMWM